MEIISPLGRHILIDYYGCKSDILADPNAVEVLIKSAASVMKATIIMSKFHHFSPLGVSGVLVIAESHITIHTWPEHGFVAIDIFYCGNLDIDEGLAYLQNELRPAHTTSNQVDRGVLRP
jgi:S-adenosylmethionine decarboxylase